MRNVRFCQTSGETPENSFSSATSPLSKMRLPSCRFHMVLCKLREPECSSARWKRLNNGLWSGAHVSGTATATQGSQRADTVQASLASVHEMLLGQRYMLLCWCNRAGRRVRTKEVPHWLPVQLSGTTTAREQELRT